MADVLFLVHLRKRLLTMPGRMAGLKGGSGISKCFADRCMLFSDAFEPSGHALPLIAIGLFSAGSRHGEHGLLSRGGGDACGLLDDAQLRGRQQAHFRVFWLALLMPGSDTPVTLTICAFSVLPPCQSAGICTFV